MTRNFDKIFEIKLTPDTADLNKVKAELPPGFDTDYDFEQKIIPTQTPQQVIIEEGEFEGLIATRDEWQLNTEATDQSGVQVALRRRFYNNRIPIFQFGIFYDDDLEFHPGPRFDFGGRVHSNGNLFMMASTGLYFSSKVTSAKEILTDVARNGSPWSDWNENVFIKNASGSYVKLKHDMGSALKSPANGTPLFTNPAKPKLYNPDMPTAYENANWDSYEGLFQGNLLSSQKTLDLPIRIASAIDNNPLDYVELIKRGKSVGDLYNNGGAAPIPVTAAVADSDITKKERYYNKTGIRISLADAQNRLPGCALVPAPLNCGVELTGGTGYVPKPMTGYQATEINGERFKAGGRNVWIKVEAVGVNPVTNAPAEPRDITQDILSLGVTQAPTSPPSKLLPFYINGYGNTDSRSIIKLQRFNLFGVKLTSADTAYATSVDVDSVPQNYVQAAEVPDTQTCATGTPTLIDNGKFDAFITDNPIHWKETTASGGKKKCVVAFPINMFDTREGLYNDNLNTGTTYPGGAIPWNGVMSMVDIDIANLKKFLDGTWNGEFPTDTPFAASLSPVRGLRSPDIPSANGWVLYISDRRGDTDFDGEYDMEDIYGDNDGILQKGEDINKNNVLNTIPSLFDTFEAAKYTKDGLYDPLLSLTPKSYVSPAIAAVFEHRFYRRGVRLINGETLPGIYDKDNPNNTRGFTVASENGVYVQGNYNAFGISSVGTPTPSTGYLPKDTPAHIPASIAADSVTILSRSWTDAGSFRNPFNLGQRKASETFVRFAMLAGDALSSKNDTPNQGGGNPRMAGGVHNFKRFLEDWGSVRLNYAGSLINLYNAHNNNGAFKCCVKVYSPPTRNWVFDTTFLDPNRLPPGTPFFQTIQLTGFQRLD